MDTEDKLKPCPRCGAKNSHAIYAYTEKVWANDRTIYLRFIGIRCDDCGFSLDGYWSTNEAVTKWNANAVKETLEADRAYQRVKDDAYERGYKQGKADVEPHWIPVTERLPEKNGRYCVTLENGYVCNLYYNIEKTKCYPKGFYYLLNNGSMAWLQTQSPVVAWMPLPERWKG